MHKKVNLNYTDLDHQNKSLWEGSQIQDLKTSWRGGDISLQRNPPFSYAWAPQPAGQSRSLSPPAPTCLQSFKLLASPYPAKYDLQCSTSILKYLWLTWCTPSVLIHCLTRVLISPTISLLLSIPALVSALWQVSRKCSFDHISLLLQLLQCSQFSHWWLSPCVVLRGEGGAGSCKKNKYHY